MNFDLSPDQQNCVDAIVSWWKDGVEQLITMGGFAGTGKTTVIATLRNLFPNTRIAFCAYTGKAASVLKNKLNACGVLRDGNFCGTIHSMIYNPILDKDKKVIGWELKSSPPPYDLIVIDEASMISEQVFFDLESFKIPILATGDHGQLPPIGGDLNLMENPVLKLEKLHRQAEDNPIVKLSFLARTDGYIPYGVYGKTVVKAHAKDRLITEFINNSNHFQNTVILCGFNKTRVDINKRIRKHFGHVNDYPECGERVLCLKNNRAAKDCPIYNGVQGIAEYCKDMASYLDMIIKIDGECESYCGPVSKEAFNNDSPELTHKFVKRQVLVKERGDEYFKFMNQPIDYFDYGYCLSVHKSQGSEWKRVMVIEQPCKHWAGSDWNRWLYTAVTRASEQLLIVR